MPKKEEPQISFSAIADQFLVNLSRTAQNPGLAGYKPHPSQLKFHTSTAKEKLYIGGNRSGKTVGSLAEAAMRLTGEHPYRNDLQKPPVRGRIVAVDIEDGIKKIVIPEMQRWIPPRFLKNGKWEDSYDAQGRTLRLTNGSFVEFMSYEQEVSKFAGTSRHFCAFDEEPPEDIFNECIMRLVDTDGDYWIAMTPLIEMTWVDERIMVPAQKGDEGILVLKVNTEENPHVKIEALDRLTRGLSQEERDARRKGKLITFTSLVYPQFKFKDYKDKGHIIPDIVPDLHNFTVGWSHFTCMDHGWANPTVFLFCCVNSREQIFIYDEIYVTKQSVAENAQQYLQKLETLNIQPMYCVGDPSIRNTSAITKTSVQTEYMEHGVGIALGHNQIIPGLARVQNRFLKNKLFISERCEHTLKEISKYRMDRFTSSKLASRRNQKEKPIAKDDHCMDAMRYGIMAQPALEGETDVQPVNWLNASLPAIDFDYEKMFSKPDDQSIFDENLGINW